MLRMGLSLSLWERCDKHSRIHPMDINAPRTPPRKSATFDDYTLAEIRRAATTGIYDIRGAGTKRKVPHFDDLLFLGASVSRYPLEGYREKCATDVWLGTRFAKNPIHLKIPITIAGMSFGALGANAKEAIGRAATAMGTSTTTGDGGITPLPAVRLAVESLQELDMHRKVQLIVSGGIRSGADVGKALALGADAVAIGVAALIALGDNAPELDEAYRELGSAAG